MHFGTPRLQKVWETLLEKVPEEANRTAVYTNRILTNITEGEKRSAAKMPDQNSVVPTRNAATDERFKTSCIAASERHLSSDWFELYRLFKEEEYTINDLRSVFLEAQKADQADIALLRLCMGKTLPDDPGYSHLTENPPALQRISELFKAAQNANEVELAWVAFARPK